MNFFTQYSCKSFTFSKRLSVVNPVIMYESISSGIYNSPLGRKDFRPTLRTPKMDLNVPFCDKRLLIQKVKMASNRKF